MARAPNEKVKKAYELYKQNYKLKDIASKLEVAEGTVRSWKNRYSWDNEKNATLQTEKCNVAKKTSKKVNKKKKSKVIIQEVESVIENAELTDKQRLFCIYYIKYFNATKAYKKAYGCSNDVALVNGSRLLGNANVKSEIETLKRNKLNRAMLSEDDIFQKYIDIAFSDIGDYLGFRKERRNHWAKDEEGNDIPIIDPDTGEQKYSEYNIVELNDSLDLDTTIISEVSEGKEGVKLKLQDKMKALQWLADRMDLLTKETQIKLENERVKLYGLAEENDNEGIDNFIKATTMSEAEIKEMFKEDLDGEEETTS